MSSTNVMSARDYQHTRFRHRDSSNSNSNSSSTHSSRRGNSSSVNTPSLGGSSYQNSGVVDLSRMGDSTPPRIVTPTHQSPVLLASTKSSSNSDYSGLPVSLTMMKKDSSSTSSHNNSSVSRKDEHNPYENVNPASTSSKMMAELERPEGSRSPMLHKPTATSGGLTYTSSSPYKYDENSATTTRYSLSNGRQESSPSSTYMDTITRTPNSKNRRASEHSFSHSSKLKAAHSLALQKHASDSKLMNSTGSTSSKIHKQDPSAYKIFLLLLQPKSKIFELIQLIYSPMDTTIGDILNMIPENATEKALGKQDYIGLCRPKTQEEILDTDRIASEVRPGVDSAQVTLGEILVAIPKGYTGPDVASLSKQILANPKIVKLLKRADPLAPKHRSRRSSRRHPHHRNSRSRASEQVHVLERHDETEEEQHLAATATNSFESNEETERRMKLAMEHAAAEAAAANAAIPRRGSYDSGSADDLNNKFRSIISSDTRSLMDLSVQGSTEDSSYSSWSRSFDASFSLQSSICSGVSHRAHRRRERQARRMKILQRSGMAAFGIMVMFYILDPQKADEEVHRQHELQTRAPMGIMGIFQCLFLLLTLYKIELLVRTTAESNQTGGANNNNNDAIYMSEERRCPFLKASARALKRFKAKYSKRLNTNTTTTTTTTKRSNNNNLLASGSVQVEPTMTYIDVASGGGRHRPTMLDGGGEAGSLSNKLRSFSLKAAAIQDLDTDTGSL